MRVSYGAVGVDRSLAITLTPFTACPLFGSAQGSAGPETRDRTHRAREKWFYLGLRESTERSNHRVGQELKPEEAFKIASRPGGATLATGVGGHNPSWRDFGFKSISRAAQGSLLGSETGVCEPAGAARPFNDAHLGELA